MFTLTPLRRNLLIGIYGTSYAVCVKYIYQDQIRKKKALNLLENYPNTEHLYSTLPQPYCRLHMTPPAISLTAPSPQGGVI